LLNASALGEQKIAEFEETRDAAPPASQDSAAPAAFFLNAMAAPPSKWVSGGAPTLPCMHERAVARLLWWEE
jgi:hypothetical protein